MKLVVGKSNFSILLVSNDHVFRIIVIYITIFMFPIKKTSILVPISENYF